MDLAGKGVGVLALVVIARVHRGGRAEQGMEGDFLRPGSMLAAWLRSKGWLQAVMVRPRVGRGGAHRGGGYVGVVKERTWAS